MQRLVGIIRKEEELRESLEEIAKLKERAKKLSVEGHRQYNPGWHLALDLANMLVVSECIAKAALEREESRGGHTRDDFPTPDDKWGALNLVLTLPPGSDVVDLKHQPLPVMPDDLKELF
jgi:succinate dehydrogenase / fumarate reductase flavoprotein subunit